MIFCIDIGNTNIVLGVADGDKILEHWRIKTEKHITADELSVKIDGLFRLSHLDKKDITEIIISSVVPPLLNILKVFCLSYFNIKPLIVSSGINLGMPVKYDDPESVGLDRVVNAIAAYDKYREGLIVIDFGTATTFDCVSDKGEYLGGVIVPGIRISIDALFHKTSKLPRVETFNKPENIIAQDTVSSMNAGIIYGYAALVDGIVTRMWKEMGNQTKVISTGGLASVIFEESDTIDYIEELLTLKGLILICERNR